MLLICFRSEIRIIILSYLEHLFLSTVLLDKLVSCWCGGVDLLLPLFELGSTLDGRLCSFTAVVLPQVSIDFLNIRKVGSTLPSLPLMLIIISPSVGWAHAVSVMSE